MTNDFRPSGFDPSREQGVALIHALGQNRTDARHIAMQLEDIAGALDRVGNARLADELAQIGVSIVASAEAIWRAHGAAMREESANTAMSIGRIFNTLLRDSGSDRNGEDAPAAECAASQSGPTGIAQPSPGKSS